MKRFISIVFLGFIFLFAAVGQNLSFTIYFDKAEEIHCCCQKLTDKEVRDVQNIENIDKDATFIRQTVSNTLVFIQTYTKDSVGYHDDNLIIQYSCPSVKTKAQRIELYTKVSNFLESLPTSASKVGFANSFHYWYMDYMHVKEFQDLPFRQDKKTYTYYKSNESIYIEDHPCEVVLLPDDIDKLLNDYYTWLMAPK